MDNDDFKPARFADLQAEVTMYLADTANHPLTGVTSSVLPGGCHSIVQGIELPIVPPGTYVLHQDRRYQINPMRTVMVHGESKPFQMGVTDHRPKTKPNEHQQPNHTRGRAA